MSEKNTSITKARIVTGFGLLVLVFALNIISTQFIADKFAYHPSLGPAVFGQIYSPFSWWQWSPKFFSSAPNTFLSAYAILVVGVVVLLQVYSLIVGLTSRSSRKHEGTHGTAHFATPEEVQATGLLPAPGKTGAGVYCGAYEDEDGRIRYLRDNSNEPICVIAPTGSGKGVGQVIPTLLSWLGSAFVIDIKGENYAITSGWRQKHAKNRVFKFNPGNRHDSCFKNPLSEIRIGTDYQIEDSQNTALIIIDSDGKGIESDHWRSAAYQLLSGVILHALYKTREASLRDCAYMLKGELTVAEANQDDDDWRPLSGLFLEMQTLTLDANSPSQRDAQRFIRGIGSRMGRNTPARELGSILSTASNSLELYCGKNVGEVTSQNDFMIADLMDSDDPVTLYFIIEPKDINRLRPLTRLILTQITNLLTGQMQFSEGRAKTAHKHKLLLMPDEFASLGKLEVFKNALPFLRGYGIKVYLIIQDFQQLYDIYGTYQGITSNCRIQIAYLPNRQETADLLSKMAGQTTVVKEQVSTSGKRFGASALQNVSSSWQEVSRPLMTSDEVKRLEAPKKDENGDITESGEILIFVAGHPVIRGKQILYFQDPTFSARSKIPPPTLPSQKPESDEEYDHGYTIL